MFNHMFLLGVRHSLPIVMGYLPVGIAYAVLALKTGFTPVQTLLMSLTCYSGSGQFLGVAMAGQGAGILAVAVGILLINFRYFIMSACVFVRFTALRLWQRLVLCHFVTDETFAIFTTAPQERVNLRYFLGLFLTSYLAWFSGAALGIVASTLLPEDIVLALGIALYALFIAIIVPGCRQDVKLFVLVVAVAAANTLLAALLERHFGPAAVSWGIVLTSLCGALVGAFFIPDPQEHGRDTAAGRSATEAADTQTEESAAHG